MATQVDPEFFIRMRALNEKFAASVPGLLDRIAAARDAVDPAAPAPAPLNELHEVLHTVAGSAGTFGYTVLGQQARVLVQRLRPMMADPATTSEAWASVLAEVDVYVAWGRRDPKAPYI